MARSKAAAVSLAGFFLVSLHLASCQKPAASTATPVNTTLAGDAGADTAATQADTSAMGADSSAAATNSDPAEGVPSGAPAEPAASEAPAETPMVITRPDWVRRPNAEDMARYVGRHLQHGAALESAQLGIDGIEDLRAYQTLLTLALRGNRIGGLRREDPLGRLLRGFRVELLDAGDGDDNDYLRGPRFRILRVGAAHHPESA